MKNGHFEHRRKFYYLKPLSIIYIIAQDVLRSARTRKSCALAFQRSQKNEKSTFKYAVVTQFIMYHKCINVSIHEIREMVDHTHTHTA